MVLEWMDNQESLGVCRGRDNAGRPVLPGDQDLAGLFNSGLKARYREAPSRRRHPTRKRLPCDSTGRILVHCTS